MTTGSIALPSASAAIPVHVPTRAFNLVISALAALASASTTSAKTSLTALSPEPDAQVVTATQSAKILTGAETQPAFDARAASAVSLAVTAASFKPVSAVSSPAFASRAADHPASSLRLHL